MLVKKITLEWLEAREACDDGVEWFKAQSKTDSVEVLNSLLEEKELDWANWLIFQVMDMGRADWSAWTSPLVERTDQTPKVNQSYWPVVIKGETRRASFIRCGISLLEKENASAR